MIEINKAEYLLPMKLYHSPDVCAKDRYAMCILNEATISNKSDIIWRNMNEYCQNF